jgi:replicative DNA helicase
VTPNGNGKLTDEQVKAELDRLAAGRLSGDAGDGWAPPAPLTRAGTLPPFPAAMLPGWLASFVQAVATATQTPTDLAGLLAVSALATAAGGRVEVQPRAGWREPLNLFTAVALPPGNRKSAVFAEITKPLHDYERSAVEQLAPIIAEAALAKKVAQERADKAQAAASKAPADQAQHTLTEARELAAEAEALQVPLPPRMLADDATPEALVSLLAGYGRIAILSAEGGVFDMMAGRYTRAGVGPPLDAYLKGHAGDPIRVDRKGREPEFAERPALTVGLAVQPDVLRFIADQPGFRGRGLLARFLYAIPRSTVGRRQVGPPPVPETLRSHYQAQMRALCASLAELGEPALLLFDTTAERLLLDFEADLEPRLGDDGELGHIADWGSKLTGAAARIAGLLHLASNLRQGWARPVGAEPVIAAIEIATYLTQHALAVFDAMGADPRTDDARWLLDWIGRTGQQQFTRRDAHMAAPRGRFRKAGDLDPPLALLEEHGYLRHVDPDPAGPKGGRPPSPRYLVNPLHPSTEPTQPTKPHPPASSVGCVGSVDTTTTTTATAKQGPAPTGPVPPSPHADGNGSLDRYTQDAANARQLVSAIAAVAGNTPQDHADAQRLATQAPDLAALIDPTADPPAPIPWDDEAPLAWALAELERRATTTPHHPAGPGQRDLAVPDPGGWRFQQPTAPCVVCTTDTTNRAPSGQPLHLGCAPTTQEPL